MTLEPIDLHHQAPGIVGCYLLETEDGRRSSTAARRRRSRT